MLVYYFVCYKFIRKKHRKRIGLSRSIRTKKAIKALRERIRRNPIRKQKILSREMKIAPRAMSRTVKEVLRPIRDRLVIF